MLLKINNVSQAFLFTDVEGSTSRWERNEPAMRDAMARHDAILRGAVATSGGQVFKTSGDGLCAVFPNAAAALRAAQEAQSAMQIADFSAVGGMRVRMAVHSGVAETRDKDYFGPPLNRVARLLAAAHGGQILLSAAAADAARSHLAATSGLLDLGRHRLKDLEAPERVFQLRAPGLPAEFPAIRSLDSMPNNLPRHATSFIGREDDLAILVGLIGQHRLVTMLGSGGIGKTRLALQLGADCLARFADGVWLVELAPLTQPEQIAEAVAGAVGFNGQTITNASVVTYLKYQRLMLIIDNCEHLIEGAAAVADAILKSCPGVTLLATSREKLRLAGEQIFPVPTLAVPKKPGALSVAEAIDHASVRLFVERAALAVPGFTLDAGNAPAIGAICKQLDGIALAIELVAARIKLLSPAELLGRLRGRFDIVSGGSRTAMPRQQTLYATIAWSFDLLSPREQRALCRLAVFEGSFSLDTAAEVMAAPPIDADEAFDLIASLADKSMISRLAGSESASRYRMLEMTRQFCLEKLSEYGEADAARRRLALAMVKLYGNATQSWPTQNAAAWRAIYLPDFENLSAAVEWVLTADVALGLELISFADEICNETSNYSILRRWYEIAESLIGPETPPRIEARIRSGAAWSQLPLGSSAKMPSMVRALKLFRTLNDLQGVAHCLGFVTFAQLHDTVEDAQYQRACGDELKAMLSALKRDKTLSFILGTLAVRLPPHERLVYQQQAEAIAADFGDKIGVLQYRCDQTRTYFQLGDLPRAMEINLRGAAECRDSGDKWITGRYFSDMVALGCMTGRLAEAREAAPVAMESFRSFDYQLMVDSVIERVALLTACEGKMSEAAMLAGYCAARFAAQKRSRDGLHSAVQERLITMLESALPPSERAALMRQGAAWSPEYAYEATLAIVAP